nr:reverse transcriptase domain-containing protein [Tanacetum cinerariifolium]
MFKQLHININLADALILIPKYQKMLKALLSNKEKLLELANTPLNENCSAVILKNLPEKLRDPGKFLILRGFNELKCKALVDLGASINLMPLSIWKKLGLPELISTRMTLELANRAICTPAGIAKDVFVSVGKFTFPADFVIVNYESDPKVPLILRRPFLQTARALIDVHREEMILRDGDEQLTLNMRHDTSSYSNQPQKESINLINVFNDSNEDFLEDLFSTNHQSGNPTSFSHPELTLPKVKDNIFDLEGGNVLLEKLLDLDSTNDLHPPLHVNPLRNDDLSFDIESNLKEIEYLLHHDPIKDIDSILKDSIDQNNLVDLNDNFVDSMPEIFTDEHALDYSSHPLYDEYDDDLFEVESNTKNVYDDPFNSKGEKIKESKLLVDKLDLPCDFILPSEYDSFISEDFSEVDDLPSTNNEDKVFNLGILIQENLFEIITRVAQDKKLAISHVSLMLEDFDHPLYFLSSKKFPGIGKTERSDRLEDVGHQGNKSVLLYTQDPNGGKLQACYSTLETFKSKSPRRFFQIPIALEDQEKITFTCPYETFACRRMPFGLCNASATFQRCMTAIFHDMLEDFIEVFMDDFSVFGNSFDRCLHNLDKMLGRCEETKLVLNWEKCHIMVKDGIVLGHKNSGKGINVDKAKIDVIAKLPYLTNVKGVRKEEIDDKFPDEHLMILKAKLNDEEPWYADYVNYIVGKMRGSKRNPRNLAHCHSGPVGGHYSSLVIGMKVYKTGFYWPSLFKDANCDACQKSGNISSRNEMPQNNIQVCEVFDVCRLDFMGPFTDSRGNKYILVAVDYVSRWVEARALPTNDARIVIKFLKGLFARFGVPKALISDSGTRFCNSQLEKSLLKYGVTHRISTAYHPQTNGQTEFTNRAIKRILERSVGYNPKDWSKN